MDNIDGSIRISTKRRGNKLGFWFFKFFLNCFGLAGAYGLLYFVCLHYLIFDREAVSKCLSYIKRRFPKAGFFKMQLHVYRLFISQGKQLIDRFALISGRHKFNIQLNGYDDLKKILSAKDSGFVLLTAHVGNWQIALTTLKKMNKHVHLVMRPEDNNAVRESLGIDSEDESISIISPEGYLGGVVESMSALKNGDIVSLMGDRKYGFEAVEVSFLKDKAYFPFGAFSIAASANCPVVVLLSSKVSKDKYIVDISNVIYPKYEGELSKREQLKKYVQEFAGILDKYVLEYPYQCFLFHDVWKSE